MATWSRKTYQMVADILHEAYKDRDMVNIWDLMQRFGVEFRMDNPNFDEARFRKASIGGNTEPAGQEPTYDLVISPELEKLIAELERDENKGQMILLQHAYRDIDGLLQEGFDSNAEEQIANLVAGQPCIEGVAETLTHIKNILGGQLSEVG